MVSPGVTPVIVTPYRTQLAEFASPGGPEGEDQEVEAKGQGQAKVQTSNDINLESKRANSLYELKSEIVEERNESESIEHYETSALITNSR